MAAPAGGARPWAAPPHPPHLLGRSGAGAASVVPGRRVRVVVPGSSANLGPGFDAVGLALGVHDEVEVEALDAAPGGAAGGAPRAEVVVTGEGAASIATGPGNLVVRSVAAALRAAGAAVPGLRVVCANGVPHGRGAGSSAAAVVAGVAAASALLDEPLTADEQLDLAAGLEGHPDNAAASLLGGLTLGWREDASAVSSGGGRGAGAGAGRWRAVRVEPHADLRVLLCLPDAELSTARARAMLPLQVPHADAAHAAGRAALLVEALTRTPSLLLPATEDRLHQAQRAGAMPATWSLLGALRAAGHAAVVSGAGPSVLVLCAGAAAAEAAAQQVAGAPGWRALAPGVAREGARAQVTLP